jgi:hypothetical protein
MEFHAYVLSEVTLCGLLVFYNILEPNNRSVWTTLTKTYDRFITAT